jgi:hypothetical protein
MSDEEQIVEVLDDSLFSFPSYSDPKAQRCLAFQCLAEKADKIVDEDIKRLALQMLTAMIQVTADKPIRGLKAVE